MKKIKSYIIIYKLKKQICKPRESQYCTNITLACIPYCNKTNFHYTIYIQYKYIIIYIIHIKLKQTIISRFN